MRRVFEAEEYLSVKEAAKRLCMAESTIHAALAQGRTSRDASGRGGIWPVMKLGPRCVRIPARSLNVWMRAHTEGLGAQPKRMGARLTIETEPEAATA
jgi:predicted DNA-binding transcriptional regulator AlpA